jgi:uncharacterized protein
MASASTGGYTAGMSDLAPSTLTPDDYQALDELLDGLRARVDEVPQWEFCEGYMAALLCCRRAVAPEEYWGALLSDPDTGTFGPQLFADPASYARFVDLWERRWAEVAAELAAPVESLEDERCYAPKVSDLRGAVAAMDEAERAALLDTLGGHALPSFGQVWALGFMYAVETWPEEWAPPRDKEAAGWVEDALDRIVAMTEDDEDEPQFNLLNEGGPPSISQARLNAYGDAIWAVYDLYDTWKHVGPRVETVRKATEPGRNDPCPCGSGKKYKKCCGA